MLHALFTPVAALFGILALILHVVLIVKIFKHGGIFQGILGICVPFFSLIWGWMKVGELGIKKLMIWLTLSLILAGLFHGVGIVAKANSPTKADLKIEDTLK